MAVGSCWKVGAATQSQEGLQPQETAPTSCPWPPVSRWQGTFTHSSSWSTPGDQEEWSQGKGMRHSHKHCVYQNKLFQERFFPGCCQVILLPEQPFWLWEENLEHLYTLDFYRENVSSGRNWMSVPSLQLISLVLPTPLQASFTPIRQPSSQLLVGPSFVFSFKSFLLKHTPSS